jgi:hypothetical protein
MAKFMEFGSKTYYLMQEPTILGLCHYCAEDVDKWDRACEMTIWVWERHEVWDADRSQTTAVWEPEVKKLCSVTRNVRSPGGSSWGIVIRSFPGAAVVKPFAFVVERRSTVST